MKKEVSKNTSLFGSINNALEGWVSAIKTEKNLRRHVYIAILILMMCLIFGVTKSELKDITLAITLVFFAELINTAIESTVDICTTEYHPLAKKAKDIAAAAVLLVSVNAVVVGYIVFSKRLKRETHNYFSVLQNSYIDTFLLILAVVVIGVFIVKAYYRRGKLLQGGMPSGHSAVAFALWVGVSYTTKNVVVIILSFGIAFLVAQSRVEGKIHSPMEVLAGSTLGVFVTYTLLKLIF